MQKTRRDVFIDAAKAMSIVFVVVTHCPWTASERLGLGFPFWIGTAMPVFMLLSGFLYARSCSAKGLHAAADLYGADRLIRSLARFILPFAPVAAIEMCAGLLQAPPSGFADCFLGLMLGGRGPGSYYIPVMIQFAVVAPLMFWTVARFGFAGLLALIAANAGYETVCTLLDVPVGVYRLLMFRYLGVVAIGMYFCCSGNRKTGKWRILLWSGAAVFGAIYLYFVCYGGYEPHIFLRWKATSLPASFYAAGMFFVLYSLARRLSFGGCAIVTAVGSATYEIFLVQKLFYGYVAAKVFKSLHLGRTEQVLLGLMVCVGGGLIYRMAISRARLLRVRFTAWRV